MTAATLEERAEALTEAPRKLVPVELGDIVSTVLQPPRFVVNPILPRGAVTLLGGHGGAGKSMLGLTIAAHVAAGRFFAELDVVHGAVLFASLEDPGEIVAHRLRRIVEAYGLKASTVARSLSVVDGSIADAALAFEHTEIGTKRLLRTDAFEELEELASGAALIVVDNASDAYDANENDRRMVRAFMRLLAKVARENDAAVLLLAHIDKTAARYGGAGNSYSGSTAWHNSARSRLALITDDGGGVELRHEKSNHGRVLDPIRFVWSEHGVMVPDRRSALPEPGDDADADAVLEAMRAAAAVGADVPAARNGPQTGQALLATFSELPGRLKGSRGREAFWAAVGRLIAAGRVSVRESRDRHRNARRYLVAAEVTESGGKGACVDSPTPPSAMNARALAGCASYRVSRSNAEPTRTNAPCPACDGEGCPYCATQNPR